RAVAPPYPGAFTELAGKTYRIDKARLATADFSDLPPGLAVVDNHIFGVCGDGRALSIINLLADGETVTPAQLQQTLSSLN
ncbi:MAG: formyltransferase, partial [Burkholderiaceae bacterium]|nr:formyltransferase [Burkholderiaceae bacterium]